MRMLCGASQVAEKYFLHADAIMDAINMYNAAGKWEESHRVRLPAFDLCYYRCIVILALIEMCIL